MVAVAVQIQQLHRQGTGKGTMVPDQHRQGGGDATEGSPQRQQGRGKTARQWRTLMIDTDKARGVQWWSSATTK
jgi:hypothetical protein